MHVKFLRTSPMVLAYPHGWQQPAKTEQWAYECCTKNLPDNRFIQLVCFPWATLIDLQRKGHTTATRQYEDVLWTAPPKTTLIRATVCQHIYDMDMLPWFKGKAKGTFLKTVLKT